MKRPLAVLTAAVLAGIAVVVPAAAAGADAPAPTIAAVWVNDTLRVTYPWVETGKPGDQEMLVEVDGRNYVRAPHWPGTDQPVTFSLTRKASAGPAKVEVVASNCVDEGEFMPCTDTTVFSAVVTRHVVKAKPGQVSAFTLLNRLPVAKETHAASYARSRFAFWVDADHDGESTRDEVLKAESTTKVTESSRHRVARGRWVSAYDGRTTTVASKLAVVHLVPLEEAWTSGAWKWSAKKRVAYANDLGYSRSLIAVSKQAAQAKGAKEPNAYLPTKASAVCAYVRDYIAVKYRWGLGVDAAEKAALQHGLVASCANPYVTKPHTPDVGRLVG